MTRQPASEATPSGWLGREPAPPAGCGPPSKRWRWGAAGLAAVLVAVYAPVVTFGFLDFDDGSYITQNPHLAAGLSFTSVTWAFTDTYFSWWHPLTWLSHLLDVSLFGTRAGGHHATSALLHVANALLCTWVLRRFGVEEVRSLLVTALVFLHPTRVESVAWVSERKDLMFVLFGLWALLAWARYREQPGPARYAMVCLGFAASLASKSMLVTFPVLLLVLDAWLPPGSAGRWSQRVVEKLPLLAISAAVGAVTIWNQKGAGAVQSVDGRPLVQRLETVPLAYLRYLENTFWPRDLCAYYPLFRPVAGQWVAALLLLSAAAAALVHYRARLPHLAAGASWFFLALLPLSGLVQVGGALVADRYLYWPHLGLMAGLVLSLPATLFAHARGLLLCGAVAASLAALSALQVPVWKDSETLYRSTLEVEPRNPFIQTSLGLHLLKTGRAQEAVATLAASASYSGFSQSIFGLALLETGSVEAGLAQLDAALARAPSDAGVRRNVVLGLTQLGVREARARAFASAVLRFDLALRVDPGNAEAARLRALAARDLADLASP